MIELNVDRPWFERINIKALGDDVVKVRLFMVMRLELGFLLLVVRVLTLCL
jgi:hypothetical protein